MNNQTYRYYIIPKKINRKRLQQIIERLVKKTSKEEGVFTIDFVKKLEKYIIRSKTIVRKHNRASDLFKFVKNIYSSFRFKENNKIVLKNKYVLRQNPSRNCKKNIIGFIAING